ncbi:hypothetical protein ACIOTI_18045 [Streptomyces sp. NPDC087843]|uniref:hypothetical protein n=1 Tax=Streptomyces sp. NPDC087843 TaxID=3365804 RepID=UPI0037F46471
MSFARDRTDSVDLSYDGKARHRAALGHSTAGATARLHAPAGASCLTRRVHALDARGNGVTQTIVRAVGIS